MRIYRKCFAVVHEIANGERLALTKVKMEKNDSPIAFAVFETREEAEAAIQKIGDGKVEEIIIKNNEKNKGKDVLPRSLGTGEVAKEA